MIADPDNHLAESDETNMAYTRVTLPVTRDGFLPGY